MNVEPKKIIMGLGGAFLLLTIWNKPSETGDTAGDWVGKTSDFLEDAFDKANEFSQSVIE